MSGHTIAQATSTTSANAPPFTNGHTSYESNPPPTSSSDPLTANHSLFPFSYSPQVPAVGFPSTKATDDPSRPIPPLFTPLTLRSLTLKNRIGVAPMCQYSCSDGFLSAYHLVHLGQFALGGAALIIQEATAVQPNGRISPHDAGLWKDEHIPPIQRIVDFIHSQQAAAGIQLAHAGRKASTPSPFLDERGKVLRVEKEDGGWPDDVVGPSPIPWAEGWIVPRALTLEEIDQFKRDWVAAVRRAIRCGFDFLEVHAAHGYLLTEFLSPTSNQRTDQYGGSFENRIRLLLEVVQLTRQVWPEERPLSVRLSCVEWVDDGWSLDDTLALTARLIDLGVDIIDASSGGNNSRQQIHAKPGFQVPFSAAIKKQYSTRVMTAPVGMITDGVQANAIVEQGEGDLVLLAREFLRDPHFVLRSARQLHYDITYAPQYQRAKLRLE